MISAFIFIISAFEVTPDVISRLRPLKIAAIQFHVTKEIYSSEAAFYETISGLLQESVDRIAPDLIIFPEYTLVFLAFLPFADEIGSSGSEKEALMKIMKNTPDIASPRDILVHNAAFAKKTADKLFGILAKKYGLYILSGTYFSCPGPLFQKPPLYNTALVYNPEGICFYTQDKVFLTDYEKNTMGLSPGKIDSAIGFKVDGWDIGLTICRDTYEYIWETQFSGKDLWIDIKANGASFTEEERVSFERALPARLSDSDVPFGITLCLTGQFFSLIWEGESSYIKKDSAASAYIQTSKSATEGEILYISLEP
ncbi:MAG: hypothetical protein JXJ04_08705 [Spirochaetales bacterium]|nr:hypothetical protein [Spirochaetales bacterium]